MNCKGLTPEQVDLYWYTSDHLRYFRKAIGMTNAEAAAVLERLAVGLRTGGKAETFALPARWTPYVRMTRGSKWVDERALEYLASQRGIVTGLSMAVRGRDRPLLPESTPLLAHLEIPRADHRRDCDNEGKAAIDAAKGILWKDDRWVDYLLVVRGEGEEARLTVGVME